MSIAQQQRQINEILNNSKSRLKQVQQKMTMLGQQKVSINQDINILSQRIQLVRNRLSRRKKALQSITRLTSQSQDAYRKLKQSSRLLLTSVKKQCKHVDQLLVSTEIHQDSSDQQQN